MILVINQSLRKARTIADILFRTGVLAYSATPHDAFIEMSPLYRAVLVMDPSTLPDPRDFIKKLRSYCLSVPIFALYTDKKDEFSDMFDKCYSASVYSSNLIYKMANYSKSHKLPFAGDYRLAGLNATCDLPSVTYFDDPIEFTKTEKMLIRLLTRTYPHPQTCRKIIKYLYTPSNAPQESTIRSHVALINRAFRKLTDRKLITFIKGEGYIFETPEVKIKYGLE